MKERPILFSAPMVRALLAGSKTQTRRIVKDKHIDAAPPVCFFQWLRENCPYGQTGDRLWVRETWQGPLWPDDDPVPENGYQPRYCKYRADGGPTPYYVDADDNVREGWRPSIHMPRWASRILLEIVSVRVERLQDISETDAIAEGCEGHRASDGYDIDPFHDVEPIAEYSELWESINGPGSWAADPWVWVVEFKRVTP